MQPNICRFIQNSEWEKNPTCLKSIIFAFIVNNFGLMGVQLSEIQDPVKTLLLV